MTASGGPVVDSCPNCGAPLKLDTAGNCIWCQAHVRATAPPVLPSRPADAEQAIRVLFGNPLEGEPDDIMLLQPVSNLLIFLSTTGQEAAVQDFVSHWEHKDAVSPLLRAVRAAGTRVTLEAKAGPDFDEFSDHSALYTSDEWWVVALATDLLALLAGVPGVDPMQASDSTNEARSTHDGYRRRFAKATPPDGDDAGVLRALRDAVPSACPGPAPTESVSASADRSEPAKRRHFWQHHRDR
jgi:hypothetical protein